MKKKVCKSNKKNSRRKFIRDSVVTATGFTIVPRYVLGGPGYIPPSDRLNLAAIGAGGKGEGNIANASGWNKETGETIENVVALCDVDFTRAATSFKRFPKAKRFKDFRVMMNEMQDDIDAVMVSTPDHTHAVAAVVPMQMGKHIYVEKPLAHDVFEARLLTEVARKYDLVTQMGNHGSSGDDIRRICEWIWAGTIGDVREVHCWTNRPVWPQGIPRPTETPPVPASLDWDLWLGPAPERPYHPTYHPFGWRGWWDFGTGALGDMACHIMDPAFKALKLGYPTSVEASTAVRYVSNWNKLILPESAPAASMIHFTFPQRGAMPALSLHWYDGGLMPQRPEELKVDEEMGDWDGGVLFVGDKGKLLCGTYGRNPRLLPTSLMETFKEPEATIPRVKDSHQRNWVNAIKGGPATSSPFDYAGPLTEAVLMGNLALRSLDIKEKIKEGDREVERFTGQKKLLWDGKNMKVTNYEPANQFVKAEYRQGWSNGID